ncbi:hypothetical protein BGX33_010206 [Mortierella sp. NVP41]|nr:hypothetical protein BGX33_010206 [Mortierella sp. NVP41]
MNNDKGEIMVTWSDDDDDLFREEEEAEKDERTGPLYQGKAAALAKEDWGDDLRNDIARLETSKPALAAGDDLRNAINSMTRKMKDLESPETRAGGAFASTRASSSRPLESGITLVTEQGLVESQE